MGGCVGDVEQGRELVLGFGGYCGHLPSHADVQRQIGTSAPIILEVKTQKPLPKSDPRVLREARREFLRLIS